jgi:NAD(P)H-hydrate epimerase
MIRLTRAQAREIDRLAVEKYHVPSILLMENAARSFVDAVRDDLPTSGEIGVLCGGGNNGGDGLAIARHLRNRGYNTSVVLAVRPDTLKGDALVNWRITSAMEGYSAYHEDLTGVFILDECTLIIDALFGTGLTRPIEGAMADYVKACNGDDRRPRCPVIAVDIPSGLDCDTGEPLGEFCIRADRTVTFVAEKAGFANPKSKPFTGDIVVGDIGCPREVIEEVVRRK